MTCNYYYCERVSLLLRIWEFSRLLTWSQQTWADLRKIIALWDDPIEIEFKEIYPVDCKKSCKISETDRTSSSHIRDYFIALFVYFFCAVKSINLGILWHFLWISNWSESKVRIFVIQLEIKESPFACSKFWLIWLQKVIESYTYYGEQSLVVHKTQRNWSERRIESFHWKPQIWWRIESFVSFRDPRIASLRTRKDNGKVRIVLLIESMSSKFHKCHKVDINDSISSHNNGNLWKSRQMFSNAPIDAHTRLVVLFSSWDSVQSFVCCRTATIVPILRGKSSMAAA